MTFHIDGRSQNNTVFRFTHVVFKENSKDLSSERVIVVQMLLKDGCYIKCCATFEGNRKLMYKVTELQSVLEKPKFCRLF